MGIASQQNKNKMGEAEDATKPKVPRLKRCRFGRYCRKEGCKFIHPDSPDTPSQCPEAPPQEHQPKAAYNDAEQAEEKPKAAEKAKEKSEKAAPNSKKTADEAEKPRDDSTPTGTPARTYNRTAAIRSAGGEPDAGTRGACSDTRAKLTSPFQMRIGSTALP